MDLEAQIKCVEREIGMRERVYPSFVARGKMKPEVAERELATMRAVLDTMRAVREPNTWMCGCGWVSGVNLATCAQCGRTVTEGHGRLLARSEAS